MSQKIESHNPMSTFLESTAILEVRMENDANGNPVYIGYNKNANCGTAVESWFIVKITYDVNESPTRYQLPNNGVEFIYAWDDRATYFS